MVSVLVHVLGTQMVAELVLALLVRSIRFLNG